MIAIKIQDTTYDLPTCWGDVSFRAWLEYQKLVSRPESITIADMIGTLAQHPDHTTEQRIGTVAQASTANIMDNVMPRIAFVMMTAEEIAAEFNEMQLLIPQFIVVAGNQVMIPELADSGTFGQFCAAEAVLRQTAHDPDSGMVRIAAIYLQPVMDGTRFNMDRIPQVEALLMDQPLSVMIPVGRFFLNALIVSRHRYSQSAPGPNPVKPTPQGSRNLNGSGGMARFTGWLRGTFSGRKPSSSSAVNT